MRNKDIHSDPALSLTTVLSIFYLLSIFTVLNEAQPGFSFEEEPQQEVITDAQRSDTSDTAAPVIDFNGDSTLSSCVLSNSSSVFPDLFLLQKVRSSENKALTLKPQIAKQKGFYLSLRPGIILA